jgi:hypothetical protein
MSEPIQKPGRSKQDYGTQPELIRAVELKFGPLAWDLAASAGNAKAPNFITKEQDTFTVAWHRLVGLQWLNPEFGQPEHPCKANCKKKRCGERGWHTSVYLPGCEDFMRKALAESPRGARIITLTPAAVGSDWHKNYVHNKAFVNFLNGRLTFEGETTPYPKDCMISAFGFGRVGYDVWDWRETLRLERAA